MPCAAITHASVQFKAYKNDANTDNLTLQGEAADNPVTFTDNDYDISSRPRTVASVPWSPAAWTTNSNYQTPDLTNVVQEIVNRPGWASGNALVMLVTAPGPSYGNRAAISYNYQPANAAKLSVSYNQVVTTKYYSFNGQKVAMRKNGVIYYLHSDHLGGTALVTKSDGSVESEQGYYAYGRYRTGGTLPTDHKFTGQKLDASGLYYYNARYYDPELGIFVSPDTVVPDPGVLIDYNRYAYAKANPMRFNDPSGHEPIHHSNYPCSYTTCVKEGGEWVPVPQWTPELHKMYYPTISDEPIELSPEMQAVVDVLKKAAHMELHYDDSGNLDPRATLEAELGEALSLCGKTVNGVCGVSYTFMGGAVTPVGVKTSVDFYADQNGDMAVYVTGAGGGAFVPSVASVSITGLSGVLAIGATVDNMAGWGGQFGGSSKVVGGPTAEWIFGSSDSGYWHGVSIGSNGGVGVEVHLNISHSYPIYRNRQ